MKPEDIEEIERLIRLGYYEGVIFPSGLIYQGGLYRGLPHGKGTIILPNGNTYSYEFREGKLIDGRSILFYPDGSFYEGEVSSSGQPYGRGIIRNLDGSIYYQGNWYHEYNPKIVWVCEPLLWYENGEVFSIRWETDIGLSINKLVPAVCVQMPESWDKDKYKLCSVQIMLPHLQILGCPNIKNNFTIHRWNPTPEQAVERVGFRDLRDYYEWVNDPAEKILPDKVVKIIEKSVKTAKKVIPKVIPIVLYFNFLPPQYQKTLEFLQLFFPFMERE